MQNDRNYPMVGSPSISKSHVGPGIQQKPRIWTLFSLINLWFLDKPVPPAPRPRRGCPAPAPAGRGTPESKKIYKYKIFGAFWREPPVNLQADHGQIMGRSWAVSRIFPQLCPNCTKSLYNHQRRSGAQKRRGTFAYMATPYCDFTHFQYSFSAEGACFLL